MSAPTALRAGDRVGRFEVVAPLKRGGMGAVYAAVDRATGERIALKVMLADDPASADRFEREGRVAARLDHPHVVACRAFGRDPDGRAWIAMELLRGEDLEARLARAPLPPAEAVALAMQVCEALGHAHARGVVHRDLKPGNVFLCEGPAPHARVLDFGVARLEAAPRLTRTGSPVGTPSYMSPEQARGERDVDARADLWSLGVVLYECLAGRTPFQAGSVVGTLYQIVSADPPDLARLRPDLPRALVEAVRRAMSRPRGERFESAAAMRAALAAVDLGARPAAPPALAATRADPTPAEVTATRASAGGEGERRLLAAVCLDGVRDPVFVEGVARALQGHVEPLARGATLVLFGAERWAGDEPRRALRFARAAAPACRAVGVATGRAIRGTLGGVFGVTGEAVDAAAALARADGLHIDPATAALDEAADAPDPTAPGAAPRGPFVGRAPELALLARSVADAAEALALRPVAVVGAAGLGKSHLCREALARAAEAAPGLRALTVRGELLHRDAPFLALREALARAVDPGVAALLDPAPEAQGDPVAALDRARASLRTALEGIAADSPLVVAVDDVQWLDLSSRAALRWLREQEPDLPIALWVFGRTEARDAAADLAGAAPLELGALDRADAEALLRALCGRAPEALLERAGGHPLFLESLGQLYARGELAPGDAAALPLSVEGAHLAWLDQLAPAERELARRAAVFGRHWWLEGAERLGGEAAAAAGLRRAGVAAPQARGRFPAAREFAFRTGAPRRGGLRAPARGAPPAAPRAGRRVARRATRPLPPTSSPATGKLGEEPRARGRALGRGRRRRRRRRRRAHRVRPRRPRPRARRRPRPPLARARLARRRAPGRRRRRAPKRRARRARGPRPRPRPGPRDRGRLAPLLLPAPRRRRRPRRRHRAPRRRARRAPRRPPLGRPRERRAGPPPR
ncbi:MAG: protein kinase [Polyangiales bacterium]